MRTQKVTALILFPVFVFVFSSLLFSQEYGNAIVVDIKGEATESGTITAKLKTGSMIHVSDSVYLSPGSGITILGEDGSLTHYERSFRVPGSLTRNELLKRLMHQRTKYADWLASAKKNPKNHFRAVSENDMFMVFPRNTKLTKPPERLIWKASNEPDNKFEVSLRCYENDFSYDELTTDQNVVLGSDVSIFHEKQYYWFVRKPTAELSEIPPAVWFSVLSRSDIEKFESEKKTLESIMHHDTLSVSFQLLYANLLISYELYEECRIVLDAISATEPHNPVLKTFYAVIFDKMEMTREAQKYIEYTDQIGH